MRVKPPNLAQSSKQNMSPCQTLSWQRSPWHFHVQHHQLSMLGAHHREPVASRTVFSRTTFAGVPQASPVPACPAWPKRRAAGKEKGRKPECEFHIVPQKYPSLSIGIWCLRGFTRTGSTCFTWRWGFLWDHLVLRGHSRSARVRASTTSRGRLPRLHRLKHHHRFVQLLLKFSNLHILEGMEHITIWLIWGKIMLNFRYQCHNHIEITIKEFPNIGLGSCRFFGGIRRRNGFALCSSHANPLSLARVGLMIWIYPKSPKSWICRHPNFQNNEETTSHQVGLANLISARPLCSRWVRRWGGAAALPHRFCQLWVSSLGASWNSWHVFLMLFKQKKYYTKLSALTYTSHVRIHVEWWGSNNLHQTTCP